MQVTVEAAETLIAAGKLSSQTPVWMEGMPNFAPL